MVLDVGFMRPLLVWRGYWVDEGYVMGGFKGTPGPWKVNVIGQHWNNKSLTHLEVTFGSDGECVCDTVYKIDDANLIAAAPELLDALQELVFLYEHDEGCRELTEYKRAKEAINKALGR